MNYSELSHMAGAVDDSTINIVVVIIIIIIIIIIMSMPIYMALYRTVPLHVMRSVQRLLLKQMRLICQSPSKRRTDGRTDSPPVRPSLRWSLTLYAVIIANLGVVVGPEFRSQCGVTFEVS